MSASAAAPGCSAPTQPRCQHCQDSSARFASHCRTRDEKEELLVHSIRMKAAHGGEPWSQHKALPICHVFKQPLNFVAGTYLGADLQDILQILPGLCRLPSDRQESQEVLLLLLLTCVCK